MKVDRADLIRICQEPNRTWNAHGIGMLRTYLDGKRHWRVNLWHSLLINPGISTMHTHPWVLRSTIISGGLENTRWQRVRGPMRGAPYREGKIRCGPHFDGLEGTAKLVYLLPDPAEVYGPGESYLQMPEEIHTTAFEDGSATLMERGASCSDYEASVFWPADHEWGDATRPLDPDETRAVLDAVIAKARSYDPG